MSCVQWEGRCLSQYSVDGTYSVRTADNRIISLLHLPTPFMSLCHTFNFLYHHYHYHFGCYYYYYYYHFTWTTLRHYLGQLEDHLAPLENCMEDTWTTIGNYMDITYALLRRTWRQLGDNFETKALRQVWLNFETTFRHLGEKFGPTLRKLLYNFGTTLRQLLVQDHIVIT